MAPRFHRCDIHHKRRPAAGSRLSADRFVHIVAVLRPRRASYCDQWIREQPPSIIKARKSLEESC